MPGPVSAWVQPEEEAPEIAEILEIVVDEGQELMRLDTYLALQTEYSRSLIKDWIEKGQVMVNQRHPKPSSKVKPGHLILVEVPPLQPAEPLPQPEIPLDVVFEDEDILVLNKQKGLVVHPAIGNPDGTLVNALLGHCQDWAGIRGVQQPGIVHRLDKNTTGLMVTAKNDRSSLGLQNQFRDRQVLKIYQALVHGVPSPKRGRIDQPIGRHIHDRIRMAVVQGGKTALSDYTVMEHFGNDYALVEVHLHTGRTHQIRVHMAWLGHPLVGDPMYGRKKHPFQIEGQALHCKRLGFTHPVGGKHLEFECPPPDDFGAILTTLRGSYPPS